ncbi:MAG: type II toxin-antitoxin system RatA family toxin [Betaproteobacteria bacterium]|nr:type II toxin-antitoxin system RatA family toxin [Betaproteobacteria bacterium]
MIVNRTALLPLPAEHLYDIIEAAENYPRFLPWCAGAHIVCRDDTVVSADLKVKWGGMNFEMRTRNPKRRPEYMAIHLERGPFKRFEGEWLLTVLAPDACKVAFRLDYEFDSGLMTRVAGPVFKRLTDTLVEAFIQHALATPVLAAPVVAAAVVDAPAVMSPAVASPIEVLPIDALQPPAPPDTATDVAAKAPGGDPTPPPA